MKLLLKILLLAVIHVIAMTISNGLMPYSEAFKNISAQIPAYSIFYILLYGLCNAILICLVIKYSDLSKIKTAVFLSLYLFLSQSFMTQIETLFFRQSFELLSEADIMLIMLSGIIPVIATVLMGIVLFETKVEKTGKPGILKKAFVPITIIWIGIIYAVVYFTFGYFVAWQFEALRIFYSGTDTKLSFIDQLIHNAETNAMIYPFQILRGMLFGAINLLLAYLLMEDKRVFVIATVLGFGSIGIILLIPNPLFPEEVRLAHFIEVTLSMVLFGFMTSMIMIKKLYANKSTGTPHSI